MQIFIRAAEVQAFLKDQKKRGKTIGFVPTMGALHQGHISLMEASKSKSDITVVSLFVNPTQFNNPEDFRLYPIQPEKDTIMLKVAGCDVVFMPDAEEIYPQGTAQLSTYELGNLETIMEGKFRPHHFQGVCQVVNRLLDIVNPDFLFLGRKDFQQCKVIEQLISLTGNAHRIRLVICPTLREADGLAMSSRNMRLSKEERKTAAMIYKGLMHLKNQFGQSGFLEEKKSVIGMLEASGFSVEYLEIVDSDAMETISEWDFNKNITACIAVYLGKVRLIDNMILHIVQ